MIVCGDLHTHPHGEFSRTLNAAGETPLSKRILATARWVAEVAAERGEVLLSNGDLTTTPGVLDAPSLHLLSQVESLWSEVPHIHNLGNHDRSSKHLGYHNLELHTLLDTVVVTPENAPYPLSFGGATCYVVPYTFSLEEQLALLAKVPDGGVVAVHYPIRGARMTPEVSEEGGLDPEVLGRFALTIASHYHLPQIRLGPTGPLAVVDRSFVGAGLPTTPGSIVVTGTPLAHSFGDTNDVYGVWSITPITPDTEEDLRRGWMRVHFIPNPHTLVYLTLDVLASETTAASLLEVPPEQRRNLAVSFKGDRASLDALRGKLLPEEFYGLRFQPTREASRQSREERIQFKDRGRVMHSVSAYLVKYPTDLPPGDLEEYLRPIVEAAPDTSIGGDLRFERLRLRNFLSWERTELALSDRGLVLVVGVNHDSGSASSNGGGKTALLEALAWALFGKTFRGVANDEVVRSGAGPKEGCVVEVDFEVVGQGAFTVRRTRKHPKHGTGVALLRRDEGGTTDLSASTAKATGDLVLQTLGMDWEVFAVLSFFGQGFHTRFSSLGDLGRKRLLEAILGLSRYDEVKAAIDDDAKRARTAVDRLAALLGEKEALLSRLVEQWIAVEAEVGRRKAQIAVRVVEVEAESALVLEQVGSSRVLRDRQREVLHSLEVEVRERDAARTSRATRLAEVEQAAYSAAKSVQRSETRKADLLSTKKQLLQKIAQLTAACEESAPLCPTCGGVLNPEGVVRVRSAHRAEAERGMAELGQVGAFLREVEANLQEDLRIRAEHQEKLDTVRGESLHCGELEGLEEKASAARRALAEAERAVDGAVSRLSGLSVEKEALSREDPAARLLPIDQMLDRERELHERTTEEHTEARERDHLVSTAAGVFGPKALRSFMLDDGVTSLNAHLEDLGDLLFGGDYAVRLGSTTTLKSGREDNSLSIEMTTPGGSYDSASGGERRKTDIAMHLALGRLAGDMGRGSTNLLVADEVMDTLDEEAARSVLAALSEISSEKSIFLISHSTSLSGLVPSILTVERRNSISRLV